MPELVAPIIPNAQENKSPMIALEGFKAGLAGAASFAKMRRDSEQEILNIASRERIAQDEHDFQREKLRTETELSSALNEARIEELHASADLSMAHAEAWREGRASDSQRKQKSLVSFNNLWNDFQSQADKYKLNDAAFASKDPAQYAANLLKFQDEYQMATWIPQIKSSLGNYQKVADQQKIRLRPVARDETGESKLIGEGRDVPVWQVVRRLQNDDTRDDAMNELKMNGHITETTTPGKKGDIWHLWKNATPSVTTKTVDPQTQKILDDEKRVPMEHGQNRVPPDVIPNNMNGGQAPPASSTPTESDFDPQASFDANYPQSDTDKLLQQAANAIRRGAPMKAVAQRLQEKGVDPALLWAS
jgi:hypothetical protein